LAELIRRELGLILAGGLGDPRIGFVTITRVEVAPDLTLAKIYLSVLDTPARERTTLLGLNSAKRRIRGELGDCLELRRMPELAFFADHGVKESIRISGHPARSRSRESGARRRGAAPGARAGRSIGSRKTMTIERSRRLGAQGDRGPAEELWAAGRAASRPAMEEMLRRHSGERLFGAQGLLGAGRDFAQLCGLE